MIDLKTPQMREIERKQQVLRRIFWRMPIGPACQELKDWDSDLEKESTVLWVTALNKCIKEQLGSDSLFSQLAHIEVTTSH